MVAVADSVLNSIDSGIETAVVFSFPFSFEQLVIWVIMNPMIAQIKLKSSTSPMIVSATDFPFLGLSAAKTSLF